MFALALPGILHAQDGVDAWTRTPLNMRANSDINSDIVAYLTLHTGLVLEARSTDMVWVLGHTVEIAPDLPVRGWVASAALTFRDGFSLAALPVRDEIIAPIPSAEPLTATQTQEDVDPVDESERVPARAALIDLAAYPVIPVATADTAAIFAHGQRLGRDPRVVTKIGDCNSTDWFFLHPFGEGRYTLGEYADLQPALDYFGESFNAQTYAAYNGLNAGAVLDPTWSNPAVCQPGESPLLCEYRVHNPAVAVIMFGTNDLGVLTPVQFDHYLRQVINETQRAGIIPLVSTFPRHLAHPEASILFNQIVVRVALDLDVPLINLWLALEDLPNHGIADDNFHLSGPLTQAGDLTLPNLDTGYPLRNLVTLQALDIIWRDVIQPAASGS